ncbi:sugar transferase [Campylobacter geochelonis]|uniref:Exodeoxyribonuclease 7 large subunit n=1 Tax=Campylobacter geochelonis TaxID=1780362 RepID=A0A128EJR7_9BACT|nr:sugar transferase [Campylobacter geochelonis]QKF71232.1 sugar transferase [Campylobacter geochelonis]CZE49159.1 exodeoxyribonuclease 7 large subunit [Campylobacter geochelonis]
MLVLGKRHEFTDREKAQLALKFKHFDILLDEDKEPSEARKELGNFIKKNKYKYLILNTSAKLDPKIIRYLTLLQFRTRKHNLRIITIEQFMEKELKKCFIPKDESNANFLAEIQPYTKFEYILKRCVDIVGAGCLWLINLPIGYYVRKKIREQSPGEIYFIQPRVGQNTRTFKCYKYRTMHEDSHFNPYTEKNDSRIFPMGNFMRKARIDEIPQYKNIFRGEMHLIGPRAEWDILVRNYEKALPYYHERHLVAPGITGWAQVNYPYGENAEDARQKLMYDLYYIKHWSLWLEFKTIVKTIAVIVGKKGM